MACLYGERASCKGVGEEAGRSENGEMVDGATARRGRARVWRLRGRMD